MKMDRVTRADTVRPDSGWAWIAAGFAVAIAAALVTPVGYVGSGADDEQYLEAARCWVASGRPCVPETHWWTRWPAFGPVALFTALLGESRVSVGIGPGLWWIATLVAFAGLVANWFDRRAAGIAVAFLGSTPVFAAIAFGPNVDIPELGLQVCALLLATLAFQRQSRKLAALAGAVAGLALQARDTSLIFAGTAALAWLILDHERRKVFLWAVPGMAGTIAAEMLIYFVTTGDALLRFRLALGHTAIPSAALPEGFQTDRGPLFNAALMANWKREAGITLWWPIDPWLNLLASPRSGILCFAAAFSFLLFGKRMPGNWRRVTLAICGGALLVAITLTYVLSIDPRPRMFMLLWAALAAGCGAALAQASRTGSRALAFTVIALVPLIGIQVMREYPASAPAEARARTWYAALGPDRIELDAGAASYLTLLPQTRTMARRGSGKPFVILTAARDCADTVRPIAGVPARGRVIDAVSGNNARQGFVCLVEYLPGRS